MSGLQKMQEGTRSNENAERYNYSYWDRHVISNAKMKVDMFKVPKGQPDVYGNMKTLADTNLVVPGQVANGKKFQCRELQFYYSSNSNVHDPMHQRYLFQLIEETTITLEIDGKQDMGRWTLSECFGGAINFATEYSLEYDGTSPNLNPTISYSGNNASLSIQRARIKFSIPLVLASLQIFSFQLEHHVAPNAALNGDVFKMVLSGVQASLQ